MQRMNAPRRYQSGFTLIELMIVVVVIAVLAAIALPSYREHVIKTRRAAAAGCLLEAAQIAERVYTTNMSYEDAPDADCDASVEQYYNVRFEDEDEPTQRAYSYEAIPLGSQAEDTKCGRLTLDQTGAKGENGSGTASDCW